MTTDEIKKLTLEKMFNFTDKEIGCADWLSKLLVIKLLNNTVRT